MFTKKCLQFCMLHPVGTVLVGVGAAILLAGGGVMMCRGRRFLSSCKREIRC